MKLADQARQEAATLARQVQVLRKASALRTASGDHGDDGEPEQDQGVQDAPGRLAVETVFMELD